MSSSSDMLAKLASVTHFAVSPTIVLVLTNASLTDKVMGFVGVITKLVSPKLQKFASKLYVLCNAVVVACVLLTIGVQCETVLLNQTLVLTNHRTCYPTCVLTGVWLLFMLFVDRVVLHVLNARGKSTSFPQRAAHGAAVAGLFMALAAPDDKFVFPLLLVALTSRSSAQRAPSRMLVSVVAATRWALVCSSLWALARGTDARRSAALTVLCILVGGM
jgi:hypothetical protein